MQSYTVPSATGVAASARLPDRAAPSSLSRPAGGGVGIPAPAAGVGGGGFAVEVRARRWRRRIHVGGATGRRYDGTGTTTTTTTDHHREYRAQLPARHEYQRQALLSTFSYNPNATKAGLGTNGESDFLIAVVRGHQHRAQHPRLSEQPQCRGARHGFPGLPEHQRRRSPDGHALSTPIAGASTSPTPDSTAWKSSTWSNSSF